MRAIRNTILLMGVFLLGCGEKPLDPLLSDLNMRDYISETSVTLSEFFGKHEVIILEDSPVFYSYPVLSILKRNGYFFATNRQYCVQYDRNGRIVKTLEFSDSVGGNILERDVYFIDGEFQIWLCVDGNKIVILSFQTGEVISQIPISMPFRHFRRISEDTILLGLDGASHYLASCNFKGEIKEYGLPNIIGDFTYTFPRFNDLYVVNLSSTDAVFYDKESGTFKDILLVPNEPNINTMEKQAEFVKEHGIANGFNRAARRFHSIIYAAKPGNTTIVTFSRKRHYFGLKRENQPYKMIEISSDKPLSIKNDVFPVKKEDLRMQLRNHLIYTDSEDSILLYFISDRSVKPYTVAIVEVID